MEEYISCDCCGRLIQSGSDDDFHFEVPRHIQKELIIPPAVTVCRICWENRGYKKVYEDYPSLLG